MDDNIVYKIVGISSCDPRSRDQEEGFQCAQRAGKAFRATSDAPMYRAPKMPEDILTYKPQRRSSHD